MALKTERKFQVRKMWTLIVNMTIIFNIIQHILWNGEMRYLSKCLSRSKKENAFRNEYLIFS